MGFSLSLGSSVAGILAGIQRHTTPQGCTILHGINRLHLKKLHPPLEWTGNYSTKDFAIKDKWKFSTQCMHTPGSSPVAQDIC
jgi:hypothetical protein